jgi:hypothetical protein
LLKEITRRLGQDPTRPSDEELESTALAKNIEEVIANKLVLYHSIPLLQAVAGTESKAARHPQDGGQDRSRGTQVSQGARERVE